MPDVEPNSEDKDKVDPPPPKYGDNSYRVKYYKYTLDLKVRKGRKFLEIDFVDTRAIKNKLGMTTLSELVELYKEYEKDGQLNILNEQVQKALPGAQRAEKLMKKIKFVRDLEVKMYNQNSNSKYYEGRVFEQAGKSLCVESSFER